MTFESHFIFSEVDGELAKAGLADDQFDTQQYIVFQRALNSSEQDRRLGHDNHHIEVNDESCSGYGSVNFVHLLDDRLIIQLKESSQYESDQIEIVLANREGIASFAESLQVIFGTAFDDRRERLNSDNP